MRRPPRRATAPLVSRRAFVASVLQGAGAFAVVLATFVWGLDQGELMARALAFTTLVGANLGFILVNRSRQGTIVRTLSSRNDALWAVVLAAVALLALVLYVPALREVFRVGALPWPHALACVGAGVSSVLWVEIAKMRGRVRGVVRAMDVVH